MGPVTERKKRRGVSKRFALPVVDPATGKRRWYSVLERTEAQALRMKHRAPAPAPPPRATATATAGDLMLARIALERKRRYSRGGSMARASRVRASRKREARSARVRARAAEIHAALACGNPVPSRRPVGALRAVVAFLTGGDLGDENAEPEALALARAQLARENAERSLALEEAAALPLRGLDRILVAADASAAEETYRAEDEWDGRHPERRKRWLEMWMRETPPVSPMMVIGSQRIEWQNIPAGYGTYIRRPVRVITKVPAPWEPRTEDRAAAAYDAALRSGEVARWWAPIRQAEEDRKAAWLSRMALKHPDADPSRYGVLAQQDARREAAERDAAHLRGLTADREREEKERLAEKEKAVREKYGIPEGVPVFPPKPAPASPTVAGTEAQKPPPTAPPTGGRLSAVSGNQKAGVSPPISPPVYPPPGTEEPPKAVPKASPYAPLSLSPSFQGRRTGRPRLYEFDPSEARWLKSLGFPTAEIVRTLGLPDTESARRRVREAVGE